MRVWAASEKAGFVQRAVLGQQCQLRLCLSWCLPLPVLGLRPFLQECNAAIHKKCIDKIIGRCTGTAANSRDTIVSWAPGVWGLGRRGAVGAPDSPFLLRPLRSPDLGGTLLRI